MNKNNSPPAITELGSDKHSWEEAARFVDLSKLDDSVATWLQQSEIPDIAQQDEHGQWQPDIVALLKYFCGERHA